MSNSNELIKGNEENISQKGAYFRAGISFVLLITGYILVADAPKEDAGYAIDSLHELGIKNIVMLSGDKQAIVSELADELNIHQAYGDLLPEVNVKYVEKLKSDSSSNIAFVEDGINDAPVLA